MNIKDKLLSFFSSRDCGVIIKVDNATIVNDGKNILISIPHKSFEKYGTDIVSDNEVKHVMTDKTIMVCKSKLRFKPGKKGFSIVEIFGDISK